MNMELDQTVITHAVRERTTVSNEIEAAVEELRLLGYAVVMSGLSDERIAVLRERTDAVYEKQVSEVGGEDRLRAMNDANIARGLCGYDPIFLEAAMVKPLQDVCLALFGEYFILMSQNGIINVPGTNHYQFTWHRDLNYQHYVSSRPLSLSALICLDPFTRETGGTYVLPATHKTEAFPSETFVRRHQTVVEAPPGAIILFDSMLYHRTGANISKQVRRGLNHIITLPFLKQQYSFPTMYGSRSELSPEARQFLGFGMETASDPASWRAEKLRRVDEGNRK